MFIDGLENCVNGWILMFRREGKYWYELIDKDLCFECIGLFVLVIFLL